MRSLFTILALGLVALALPSPAMARLGESEKELIARFGEPLARTKHNVVLPDQIIELGPTLIFRQGGWRMKCDLVAGRCVRINYSKPGEWMEDQIQLVLGTNAQGSAWTENGKPEAVKFRRTWLRADASTADWSKLSGMTIVWDAYHKAVAAAELTAKQEAGLRVKK